VTSRPEDYRFNTATAGFPFEAVDVAPNLPGGGRSITSYDEHDRAIEVRVYDANGELINRAVRIYDEQGRVSEERQIVDDIERLIPSEARAQMLKESGLSADELRQELRAQLTKLMGGQREPYSVSYRYDAFGRVNHMHRRIFNHEDDIQTTYNQNGDAESEVTLSKVQAEPNTPSPPSYSEVHYSYQYDQHQNWTEQSISWRSSPDGAFQPSTQMKRTLEYY
jgi:hypothetical protein